MGLHIAIRKFADVTIVDLHGRSTISEGESESLGSHLQKLVADGARRLLLNLTNLTQIDSSGLSVIVTTYVSLRGQGGELKLLGPCGRVREVLTVLRLPEVIPCFEDEAQALASFQARGWGANA